MASLSESEIAQIAKLQRDAGVQTLSCHFSWPDSCDELQCLHQEFVYDVAMFAADCGFPWTNVIGAAQIAKDIFPQLHDHDVHKLFSLLRDIFCKFLPKLTPVHQREFSRYLIDTCTTRRRLFQAVVGGAANMSIAQLHLEIQLPPTPCPLAQGIDLHEWETQQHEARLISTLQQKEEELRCLREGSGICLGEVNVPEDGNLDQQGILELVQAEVKAKEGQVQERLNQEAALLSDILQLKLQLSAFATEGQQDTDPSNTGPTSPDPDTPQAERKD
ncbi:uncharacterized protein C8orf74 homolog [Parambassis ranga]|uniref:Uncharacterized protein C8orf74 homolog n=1 Tax=Parambassis ranga TaxID=210632 RepID=A0A6P7JJ70_9TELE|nr:uncharacterized protein C8orf74 homolog [Parambassis ranga]